MQKLPVIAVIREAYDFTFANLGVIIGLIWLPMVLYTVGQFFVTQHYGPQLEEALRTGDAGGAGPALMALFLFMLAALALQAMMLTAVTQLALGQRQPGAMFNFSFGAMEWRVFRALFAVGLFLLPGYLLLVYSSGRADPAAAATPVGAASLFTSLALTGALIYFTVRLTGVLLPVTLGDDKMIWMRAWTLTAGNFWRLLGVMLGAIAPLYIFLMLAMAGIVGSAMTPGAVPTPEEVEAITAANRPLISGLIFLISPLFIGLTASASVACWRALSRTDITA